MLIQVEGELGVGVTAKDVILAIIGKIGTAGGTGHVIEYAGSTIRELSMEGRMTVCNMSIEAGARAGLVAPDETTYRVSAGPALCAQGRGLGAGGRLLEDAAVRSRRAATTARSHLDAADIAPQVTWGTSPQAAPITGACPIRRRATTRKRAAMERSLEYMG